MSQGQGRQRAIDTQLLTALEARADADCVHGEGQVFVKFFIVILKIMVV